MADTRPAKLIKGSMTIVSDLGTINDPSNTWNGMPNRWRVQLTLTPQTTSFPGTRGDFTFNARDVKVGDWLASGAGAIAVKITAINAVTSNTKVTVDVIDEDAYNMAADPSSQGLSIGNDGRCLVFELAENGLPVLAPVPPNYLDNTFQGDLLSRFFYMKKLASGGGGSDVLGTPTDGSYTDGYFPWVINTTKTNDAFDDLNEKTKDMDYKLNKLMPDPPGNLGTKALTISGALNARNGINILLASGVTTVNDSSLTTPPAAGSQIYRTTATTVASNTLAAFGDAEAGTLTARVNNVDKGSKALVLGSDVGTYGSLQITADAGYPADRPVWNALDAKINNSLVALGINRFQLIHSTSGTANAVFVVDALTTAPTVSGLSVLEDVPGTLVYSSGVPHYQQGATLKTGASFSGLAGSAYMASNIVQFTTNPLIGTLNLNPGQAGIPIILAKDQPAVVITDQIVTLTGDVHATSTFRARGSNPNADGVYSDSSTRIIYMNGTPATGIIDAGRSMSGATLKRIKMGTGSRPADNVTSFSTSSFDPGTTPGGGDAANAWEAITAGGVLRCDQTNYTLCLPVGPDYSGRPGTQYATYIIKKVASNMSITFTGVDPAEVWIKLPGLAISMPGAVNGWWDAKKSADFAPGRWPGDSGASDGCQTSKNVLTYNITFGSASSAGANDNIVMIRVALTAGQLVSNIAVNI